jgi:hypothetical protein
MGEFNWIKRKPRLVKTVNGCSYKLITNGYYKDTLATPISYFKNLFNFCYKKMDCWCVRCGCKVGEDHLEKKLYNYNGIYICHSCYLRKMSGKRNTPDFEDLKEEQLNLIRHESFLLNNKLK